MEGHGYGLNPVVRNNDQPCQTQKYLEDPDVQGEPMNLLLTCLRTAVVATLAGMTLLCQSALAGEIDYPKTRIIAASASPVGSVHVTALQKFAEVIEHESKGNVTVTGRQSPNTLYRPDIATFEADTVYDQADATGFIRLNGLRLRIRHALANKLGS